MNTIHPIVQHCIAGIIIFWSVMLLLVGLLLYLKKRFYPDKDVTILVNDEQSLVAETEMSLLSTLAQHQIYLSSACGGSGTCGRCRCQVLHGAGTILPTEQGFFTRKEQLNHWRLGCQVKVRDDLQIQIPQEILGVKKWQGTVVSNHNVATFIKELVIKLETDEPLNFNSGGYVQIDVPPCDVDYAKDIAVEDEYRKEWDALKLWNVQMHCEEPTTRAYSMANYPAEGDVIKLNVRIATPPFDKERGVFKKVSAGKCSSYLFSLKSGDSITLSGAYGDFFVKETKREMVFIGGGAGMAPLRSQIFDQLKTRKTKRKMSFWYGGRSAKELFYVEDFKTLETQCSNFQFHVALSEPKAKDQWNGHIGFIHQVIFDNYLDKHPEPEEIEYYLCGPPAMNTAVIAMLHSVGVPDEMIAFDDFGGATS
ncbi:Na(+)-translocating NADH-quinone reductase subunit F [Bacteroidia bacterium]|nr:Na(+)-translocating NADH-quinone reductase subunit F [Bacteroidia bacterium]